MYKRQVVNKLIRDGVITSSQYHEVDIHEIQMESQEGFFDYIFEDMDVFERARVNAREDFAKWRQTSATVGP